MFVCPFVFVNECGEGMNIVSHIIYACYSLMTLLFEILGVLRIERKIDNANVLKFNKWHFVETIMG